MDKMDWVMKWSASLLPDPECVPGDDVFLSGTQHDSLAADSARTPATSLQSPAETSKKKVRRRKRSQRT